MSAKNMRNAADAVRAVEARERELERESTGRKNRARIRSERKKVPEYVAKIENAIKVEAAKGEYVLSDAWKWGNLIDDTVEHATAEAIARELRKKGYIVEVRRWPIYPSINGEGYSSGSTTYWGNMKVKW